MSTVVILEIIGALENDFSVEQMRSVLDHNKDIRTDIHENTYLLEAISRNYLNAALKLLEWDSTKEHLNIKDKFRTCRNTPLILAAKTHANSVLLRLIELGADLNAQDYRGFTALHYACLYRNAEAIYALIEKGASLDLITERFDSAWCCCFSSKPCLDPCYFYQMEITEQDLAYAYGKETSAKLNHQCDNSSDYYGTRKKSLSALVWFICHVAANKNSSAYQEHKSEIDKKWLTTHTKNAGLYSQLMKEFCETRPEIDPDILMRLRPAPNSLLVVNPVL